MSRKSEWRTGSVGCELRSSGKLQRMPSVLCLHGVKAEDSACCTGHALVFTVMGDDLDELLFQTDRTGPRDLRRLEEARSDEGKRGAILRDGVITSSVWAELQAVDYGYVHATQITHIHILLERDEVDYKSGIE